jgi:hypothetical protein
VSVKLLNCVTTLVVNVLLTHTSPIAATFPVDGLLGPTAPFPAKLVDAPPVPGPVTTPLAAELKLENPPPAILVVCAAGADDAHETGGVGTEKAGIGGPPGFMPPGSPSEFNGGGP